MSEYYNNHLPTMNRMSSDESIIHLTNYLKHMRRSRRLRIVRGGVLTVMALGAFSYSANTGWHDFFPWWIYFCIWGGGSSVNLRRSVEAERAIKELNDPKYVGMLAVLSPQIENNYTRECVDSALIRLLPWVKASHGPTFTHEQMSAVIRLADHHRPDMRIAALKALSQVGDDRAVWTVEQVAQYDPVQSVRDAARECLPTLIHRIRNAEEQSMLLRTCITPVQNSKDLLRSIQDTHSIPDSELLRPEEYVQKTEYVQKVEYSVEENEVEESATMDVPN